MASNPLTKVARQHKVCGYPPQRHVSGMHYSYSSLFPGDILPFSRNIAYLALSLLTTTAFILANNDATVKTELNHQQLPNIFTLFVGYSGTGKSALVDHTVITPVMAITKPSETLLISGATSSALVKQIADNGKS